MGVRSGSRPSRAARDTAGAETPLVAGTETPLVAGTAAAAGGAAGGAGGGGGAAGGAGGGAGGGGAAAGGGLPTDSPPTTLFTWLVTCRFPSHLCYKLSVWWLGFRVSAPTPGYSFPYCRPGPARPRPAHCWLGGRVVPASSATVVTTSTHTPTTLL